MHHEVSNFHIIAGYAQFLNQLYLTNTSKIAKPATSNGFIHLQYVSITRVQSGNELIFNIFLYVVSLYHFKKVLHQLF